MDEWREALVISRCHGMANPLTPGEDGGSCFHQKKQICPSQRTFLLRRRTLPRRIFLIGLYAAFFRIRQA